MQTEAKAAERALVEELISARKDLDEKKQIKADAEKRLMRAESRLAAFMEEKQITNTAKYEGLGMAILEKPELFARCNKPDQDSLFDYLRSSGRSDLIKESVHHKSLSTYCSELLEQGEEVPDFIKYGFKQKVRVRKA